MVYREIMSQKDYLWGRENHFDDNPFIKEFHANKWDEKKWWKTSNKQPIFLYVYGPGCSICLDAEPWVVQLAQTYSNTVRFYGINSLHVEVGNDTQLVNWNVNKVPTFLWLNTYDPKQLNRLVGFQDPDHLQQFFQEQLYSYVQEGKQS